MLTWLSDQYLGTALMFDGRPEEVIEAAVMWDFVAATGVGLVTGVVFDRYVRGRLAEDSRYPDHETADLFPAEATAGPGGPTAEAGHPAADGGDDPGPDAAEGADATGGGSDGGAPAGRGGGDA
jgi:hypothetical protein